MSEELPDGWVSRALADTVAPDALIQYGILQPGPDTAGGVPYVRPTEIRDDRIAVESLRHTSRNIADSYRRSTLKAGDVILSIVGSIGKVAIVPPVLEGANITQSSARLRPRPGFVTSEFLAWFLRSPLAKRQFDEVELGTGVPRLNIGDIRRLVMPVAPVAEQRRIVDKVEALLGEVNAARDKLDRAAILLDKITQAILVKAFRGELVPTEAELAQAEGRDFEPASVLLERIRTEAREAATGSSSARSTRQGSRSRRERVGASPEASSRDRVHVPGGLRRVSRAPRSGKR